MTVIDWNKQHSDGGRRVDAFIGWLRRDRWFADEDGANAAWSVYSRMDDGRYGTSVLGRINGVLPRLGIVLVCHFDPQTDKPTPPYLSLCRRWWAI